jgi:maleylpyruvate isomerase
MRHDGSMTREQSLEDLAEATRRLVRTVDALPDEELTRPTVLPGWTRAHVVAHLTLNAEGLAGVLGGVVEGEDVPMYSSQEARDADIEKLAGEDPSAVRERFLASTTLFQEAAVAVPEDGWAGDFRRWPSGGQVIPRLQIPAMRQREVEIHHADLGAGYGPGDWPEPFLDDLFDRVVRDREGGPAMLLRTPDGDVPVSGGHGPAVSGSRADLTWWLLGRGTGEGLEADPELPVLGPWR